MSKEMKQVCVAAESGQENGFRKFNPMKQNVLLIYSGGLDSTCLLHWLLAKGFNIRAIGFDYGQRHVVELEAASTITKALHVPYEVIDLSSITHLLKSSQTNLDIKVPEGKYDDDNMKLTVVPNRNMIMIAIAAGHAMSLKLDHVVCGIHSGDHAIYPDCRPDFAEKLSSLLQIADWQKVSLERPFINCDKGGCISMAYEAVLSSALKTFPRTTIPQLTQDLEHSWSCYKGGIYHCGKCGACNERKEAFQTAKIYDCTIYEDTQS